jgi:ABC-type multidrug transport system fused ATPase/permease subunit
MELHEGLDLTEVVRRQELQSKIRKNRKIDLKTLKDRIVSDPMMIKNVAGQNEATYEDKTLFLKTNPFSYDPEKAKYKIETIEEYMVSVKGKHMTFGNLVRTKELNNNLKKKNIKKHLKNWIGEYEKIKNEVLDLIDAKVDVIGEVEFDKYPIVNTIIFLVVMILTSIIMFRSDVVIGLLGRIAFLKNPLTIFYDIYGSVQLNVIFGSVAIYVLLASMLYSIYHNTVLSDFKRDYRNSKIYLNKSKNSVTRDFLARANKVYKYYMTNYKNKKLKPYLMEQVISKEKGLEYMNQLSDSTIKRASQFKNQKKRFGFYLWIFSVLPLAGIIGFYGYLIYEIAKTIF